ncbi:hypothetical protein D3C77_797360 [compost metagenome]
MPFIKIGDSSDKRSTDHRTFIPMHLVIGAGHLRQSRDDVKYDEEGNDSSSNGDAAR